MANTGAPTDLELKLLRFFYEIELGKDPCQPVSWRYIGPAASTLVRRGLALPNHRVTVAGAELAATLPPTSPGCAGHRCDRDPRGR